MWIKVLETIFLVCWEKHYGVVYKTTTTTTTKNTKNTPKKQYSGEQEALINAKKDLKWLNLEAWFLVLTVYNDFE